MNSHSRVNTPAIEKLRQIFHDRPALLDIVTLQDLESEKMLQTIRMNEVFASHINLYVTGRTGAGKTSMGNMLFGSEVMKSTGYMNCTGAVGFLKLRSNLWFFDTPGAGSDEDYENVTRAVFGLQLIEDLPVREIELNDYTNSRIAGGKVVGVEKSNVTAEEWQASLQQSEFTPDVILYVVAPHMLFLRDDKKYFRTLLKAYPGRVVVALNIFNIEGVQVTTPQHLEDARKQITQIYQQLNQAGAPRFVEIDAIKGRGLNELTEHICALLPPEKLGKIQGELKDELKAFAENERNRRFHQSLVQIATRLAFYNADRKSDDNRQDLIGVVAAGLAQYTVMTFKNPDLLDDIHNDLQHLIKERTEEIKKVRTELVKEQHPIVAERQLTREVPILDDVEITEMAKKTVSTQLSEKVKAGFLTRTLASAGGVAKKTKSIFKPQAIRKKLWREIDQEVEKRSHKTVKTTRDVEVEVPITRVEKKVVRYETEVFQTIKEVIGYDEKVVGQTTLVGGTPVIEFLIGLGRGIKEYCLNPQAGKTAQTYIRQHQELVQTRLEPSRPQLEQLISRGDESEQEIVNLLNTKLN